MSDTDLRRIYRWAGNVFALIFIFTFGWYIDRLLAEAITFGLGILVSFVGFALMSEARHRHVDLYEEQR